MHSISSAIRSLQSGNPVIIIDDGASNISGYLVNSASLITEQSVAFMINHAKGVICAALDQSHLEEIELDLMSAKQNDNAPEMTISVEAREGVSTGISAADRAVTLRILSQTNYAKRDLVSPGHIFPVRARQGGVLIKSTIAEASIDLLKLADLPAISAYSHCLDQNGEIAPISALEALAKKFTLPIVYISEIVRKRLVSQSIIEKVAEAELPTRIAGSFRSHCFVSTTDGSEHIALVKGEIDICDDHGNQLPVLVRVQAENKIGDLLGTKNLLQRKSINAALKEIDRSGRGIFVYIRHTKLGSVSNSITPNTKQANELRQHGIGAQILTHLGIKRITLLTNSTKDVTGVNAFGLEIVNRLPLNY